MTFAASFADTIERILDLPPRSLDDVSETRTVADLGERLSGRNLGLVRVVDATTFSWPGHWVGIVGRDGGERTAIVMFGVPSGPLEDADAAVLSEGSLVDGYLLSPLDLFRPHDADAYHEPADTGTVEAIFTAPAREAAAVEHAACPARSGRGLEGDRYAIGDGTFSNPERRGQDLTLIAAEALDGLRDSGVQLSAAEARRNVVTRGIRLEGLIGHRFRIGDVMCYGARLAEPCAHLQRLTRPGVLRGLVHRGGIRADILTDGEIRVGDTVHTE
jgi:MOSC domain-containing protein YiiM